MIVTLILLAGCAQLDDLNPLTQRHEGDSPGIWGPPDTGTEGVDEAPGAGFPFDAPGRVFEIALDIPPESVEALEREGPYVPATFRFAGYEVAVGVRYKGSSTYDELDGKPSFKLDFGEFTPDATFLGLERLTLNAMKYDPTMLREAAAYRLYAAVGSPGPRHGYGRVTINGEPYGLYSLVETLDENFLDRVFPGDDDGNLYDSTFVSADLTGLGVANFQLQEGDPAAAFADLEALVGELEGGDILDVIERRFDGPSTFAYLATDLATANWDGYSRNTNNFLLYHATVADRWYFVPWGQDTAFRGGGQLYAGVRGKVAAACQAHTECRARLETAVRDVLASWEENDLHGWTSEIANTIRVECAADPRKDGDCEQDDILEFLAERPDDVRLELGP
ncbi:MAG: CotH kinase family protein [Myxococcota bacterium]